MKLKRTFLFAVLSIALISALISCKSRDEATEPASGEKKTSAGAPDNPAPEPADGDWLIYHLGAEPATLNPITATDAYEGIITGGNIYETLVKRDNKSLELKPLLAESWTISDDKLTYTFTIKKGVKWQDGVPFTADDIVFSYKTIMDPKVDAPQLRSYYQEIKNVEAD